jgi:hypothetical protein
MQAICSEYAIICIKYATNMHKICHKYAIDMQEYAGICRNMPEICQKYAINMQ